MSGTTDREVIIPAGIASAVTAAEAAALAELAWGKDVLELGAYHGFSTIVLASVAEHVTSVDWHQGDDMAGMGDSWDIFTGNLFHYGVADRVTAIRDRFENVLPGMARAGTLFDGCFLDAHHSAESVRADLALALPLVKPGGFIAFHDYGRNAATGHPGFAVTETADEMVGVANSVGFLGWGFAK